jgi:hypothetical protein
MEMHWNEQFCALFERCLAIYQSGNHDFTTYYAAEDLAFLESIGYQPREFFDFVEDHGTDLPITTSLLVASLRRDYFRLVQKGVKSSKILRMSELPAKDSSVEGIVWLPRIIPKARAKLRGELEPDIMYGCGGDRRFLRNNGLGMADFLHAVWLAGEDDAAIIAYVKSRGQL